MPTLSLVSPLTKWKKGEYPLGPFVHIAVTSFIEDKGNLLITAQLMTDQEIDHAVDRLTAELEELRRSAKRELKTILAKQLAK